MFDKNQRLLKSETVSFLFFDYKFASKVRWLFFNFCEKKESLRLQINNFIRI
jgi:hypothetical protein